MKRLVLILALCLMPIAARASVLTISPASDDLIASFPISDAIPLEAMMFQGGTTIFNCSGFSTSGACGVGFQATGQAFWTSSSSGLSGSNVIFIPTGATHNGTGMFYQTPVNVQAFTTTFSFVPNGQNFSFVINNATTQGGPKYLSSGAGCEAGFYQAFGTPPVNNVFALELDSYSNLTASSSSFTYSSAQIYQMNQSPCLPNDGGSNYYATPKISTSPVPFNSPVNTQNTTTGHVYSATVAYDGTTVSLSLYDVTAGGSCPGASCFTHSWSNVNIPSLVGSNTAYVGFTGGIGLTTSFPLYVDSFAYTVDTAPSAPSYSTYTSSLGATVAANPTFSPAAGSYSGTQNVTIASTTTGAYYCYILSASTPALMPQTDNNGGCLVGTKYTAPLSVSSSQTLYAMAGTNNGAGVLGLPSSLVVGSYTIGTPQASAPTFSPVAGTYSSAQNVTVSSSTPGATVYCSTNNVTFSVCATPVVVSTTTTLYAYATAAGYLQSNTSIAAYTISLPQASPPTFAPPAGTYTSPQSVAISSATPANTIHYSTDNVTFSVYTGPVAVGSSETLYAYTTATGYTQSTTATAAYTINLPVAATPVFSPVPGNYGPSQTVTVTDSTAGAVIHCTTDGSTPTPSSPVYSTPFNVTITTTIQCLAVASGYTNSAVGGGQYGIGAAEPVFTPSGGTFPSNPTVTITSATPGASLYYTVDGTTPTTSSPPYTGPIMIGMSGVTLKAIAVATGYNNSPVQSQTYYISPAACIFQGSWPAFKGSYVGPCPL